MMEQIVPETVLEGLIDWFETIEEMELTDDDRHMLLDISEIFSAYQNELTTMGGQQEDFEEWLRFHVLENWSVLNEEEDGLKPTVQSFANFVKNGEQRLYFHMLKVCLPFANAQIA